MKFQKWLKDRNFSKWDKSQWSIVVLVGVLLFVIAIPTGKKEETKEISEETETTVQTEVFSEIEYQKMMEKQLEDTLSRMEGAGKVQVMITLKDHGESIVEKDESVDATTSSETDSSGGNRTETKKVCTESSVYKEGDEKQPFVSRMVVPQVEGVLVVAEGGGNTAVKQNISDAVMALFQVDVNRIKVVKMNVQEDGY